MTTENLNKWCEAQDAKHRPPPQSKGIGAYELAKEHRENATPEYTTCPCCLSAYSRVDNPLEWNRVCAWNPLKYAAKTLGARNKGHTKNLTDAQREARRVQLAINRSKGKVVKS